VSVLEEVCKRDLIREVELCCFGRMRFDSYSQCTTLPADHLVWAKAQIDRAKAAKRGVILMSHHMLFSSHAGSTCGSEKDGTLSFTNDGL
jgi:hypothetical protein